ncbi:acetylornithine deacetylase [Pseudohalocynthiibacter aestuariivivens]|jgi:acetylornithine deacetylase|uniref:Acetylornithine deacetylase n=1 Tax=Pseudohalocynthiibacter aestuariivivens TaxID=1591409 RepID=A0ABV5JAF5_9RHOB|nr:MULTISPECIES: acetylornithine deacetylase [Pseudohalocynthiibacter]MBS9716000.1 acetylornithine deacetylase [Pseudohalocynthiibacter aestuariivivens]MCK0102443.1 acetylornithine deacetylase [Pseudohalocynthiibacter sp. F2068]
MTSAAILEKLIAFDTVSRNSNMELMGYISDYLSNFGVTSELIPNETGTKANLYATIGPADRGGVMLSGHTDVVPIDGQNWTKPAFRLTCENGKYYGRGTTDMKGFVACALRAAKKASENKLLTPLHLAFSYDEEIGCQGVRSMIDMLAVMPVRPAMCIVGEPTSLSVATGHKGKAAFKACCTGREGHSALAPMALNALHLGCDFVSVLRDVQTQLRENGARDADYDVPYTTVHAAKINGGVALNIVPNRCDVDFEIRNVAQDDPTKILADIKAGAAAIVEKAKSQASEADIAIEAGFSYPGLNTPTDAGVVEFVKSLTGANATNKVSFGTEGGLFSERLDVPTVVCGPGSMTQGHKPDEYVEVEQIERCDAMLDTLLNRLVAGL